MQKLPTYSILGATERETNSLPLRAPAEKSLSTDINKRYHILLVHDLIKPYIHDLSNTRITPSTHCTLRSCVHEISGMRQCLFSEISHITILIPPKFFKIG